MKIQNVTLIPAPLDAGENDEAPVYGPPPDNVPIVRLPSGEEIAQRLKEQREREVGSAKHESAVASMAADGAAAASPYAALGAPLISAGAPQQGAIIVIGGSDPHRASAQAGALPSRGPTPLMAAAFEGEAPPLGPIGGAKDRDIGGEIDALQKRLPQSTSASSINDAPTAAEMSSPSPAPADSPGDVDERGLFAPSLKARPPR